MGTRGKKQDHCLKMSLLLIWLSKMEIIKTFRSAQPHQDEMVDQPSRQQSISMCFSGYTGCSTVPADSGPGKG